MVNSPSEILALTNEPAVLVCHGRIQYANSCACTILGPGCHGRTVREIFGADIAEAQAGAFISGVRLCGKQYVLRVSPMEDSYVYFFSLQDTGAEYMNDAFLYSLRSSLSGLSVAAERIRELAENTDEEITACINGITHSYYKLSRLIRNVSAIREAPRAYSRARNTSSSATRGALRCAATRRSRSCCWRTSSPTVSSTRAATAG